MTEAKRLEVFLVEDHPVVRLGLRTAVEAQPDMTVVGEADSAETALSSVVGASPRPDLVILPVRLRGEIRGIELSREITSLEAPPYVLIYTSYNSKDEAVPAYLSGADSFVHKGEETSRFLDSIRSTVAGKRVWSLGSTAHDEAARLENAVRHSGITRREGEVLGFMLQRFANAQIAKELFIELPTVKTHVSSILRKLGVGSRLDLF